MRISHEKLKEFSVQVFLKLGFNEENAEMTAGVLIESDLRGTDTHGTAKLPQYSKIISEGKINTEAKISTIFDQKTIAVLDAGFGLGFVPSIKAMEIAIQKAREWGIGIVGVRNSGHFGPAAYYPLLAQKENMIGFISTNTRVLLPAPGGAEAVTGNNPFAFSAPSGKEYPFVFDMACSVQNFAIIRILEKRGEEMPLGWGFDCKGNPTTNPGDLISGGGFQAPVGGYKGFGISIMLDIISGLLTGASFGKETGSVGEPGTNGCGHFVAAINIEYFMPVEVFKEKIDQLIKEIKNSKVAPGQSKVRMPGERGFHEKERRLKEGIPVSEETAREFLMLAEKLGINKDLLQEKD